MSRRDAAFEGLAPEIRGAWPIRRAPALARANREALERLSAWLDSTRGSRPRTATKKERSYEIFGREKYLTGDPYGRRIAAALSGPLAMSPSPAALAAYAPVPPCDAADAGAVPAVMAVENLDAYNAVCAALSAGPASVDGYALCGAVFGDGTSAVARGALPRALAECGAGPSTVLLWWGDVDRAGAAQALAASEAVPNRVRAAGALYRRMLQVCGPVEGLERSTDRRPVPDLAPFRGCGVQVGKIARILEERRMVPQEALCRDEVASILLGGRAVP